MTNGNKYFIIIFMKNIQKISFSFWNVLVKRSDDYINVQSKILNNFLNNQFEINFLINVIKKTQEKYKTISILTEKWIIPEIVLSDILIQLNYKNFSIRILNDLIEKFNTEYCKITPEFYDKDTKTILEQLSKQYKLILIVNTVFMREKTIKIFLYNLGILEIFDNIVSSETVGKVKPSYEIFQKSYTDNLSLPEISNFDKNTVVHVSCNKDPDKIGSKSYGVNYYEINTSNKTIVDFYNEVNL